MKPIHIFRSGKHTDSAGVTRDWDASTLQSIATGYDPQAAEAPLVVGHPKTGSPAYGWVSKLEYRDGENPDEEGIWAHSHQVDSEFDQIVQDGRYKKRSASFYGPDHPGNPTPGKFYLRHVGFLGATAPAVKGLREMEFAADSGEIVEFVDPYQALNLSAIFRGLREWFLVKEGKETADEVVPEFYIDELAASAQREIAETQDTIPATGFSQPEDSTMAKEDKTEDTSVDFAQERAELDEEKAELEAMKAELEAQKQQAAERTASFEEYAKKERHEAHVARAEALVSAGKLVADHVERLAAICDAISYDASFEFGEGEDAKRVSVVDGLFDILKSQPRSGPDTTEHSASGTTAGNMTDEQVAKKISDYHADQRNKGRTITFTQARAELFS